MCLFQTEVNPGILLKEMIKPRNLMFLWLREQLQCRKPPDGYLFVSGFHKAACIVAPGIVCSYCHKTCGSQGGQVLTGKHDLYLDTCSYSPPLLAGSTRFLERWMWLCWCSLESSERRGVTLTWFRKRDGCTEGVSLSISSAFLIAGSNW